MAYSGVFQNLSNPAYPTTYTLTKFGTNNNGQFFEFVDQTGNKAGFGTGGTMAEIQGNAANFAGSWTDLQAYIEGAQANLSFIGDGTYNTYFTGLVPNTSGGTTNPSTGSSTESTSSSGTSGSGASTGSGGTGGTQSSGGGTFSSLLDQINSALGGIQQNSPQVNALNNQAQALGNTAYNMMVSMQGQLAALLGQSGTNSQNALNNLTGQMDALGKGKQSLMDSTIERMNQLATPKTRKKIDTEATKAQQTGAPSLVSQPTLFGL